MEEPKVVMGMEARIAQLRNHLMNSIKVFPDDVVVLNVCYDLVTGRCQIVGPTLPDDVCAHVRDLSHKCIEDWYEQNLKKEMIKE